jgi:pyruvate dehydrogenase E2 component (dihydrolipoamide acetyltransferase)
MADKIAMPKLGFDMAEGTLVRWVIAENEEVKKGQVLAEIETDKATVEVESTASGVVLRHLVDEGAVVPVGELIAIIGEPGEDVELNTETPVPKTEKEPEPKKKKEEKVAKTESVSPAEDDDSRLKASPIARRMAEEYGLVLAKIEGSGPGGRVVKKDIEIALESGEKVTKPEAVETTPPVSVEKTPAPLAVSWMPGMPVPEDEHIPVNKLRAIIGKRMLESKTQLPHFYITDEYDAGPLMVLRKEVNLQLPEDQKLSINDFIIKAAALTLRQFPNINASLKDNEIVHHGHVNVGVAVALDSGLMTIVCKDADQKPIRIISNEIKDMATRSRQGKVRPEDIEGSTFSISNLGMFDVEHFIAIINPPEAGILAVGSVKEVPVVVSGEIKVGLRMKMTISADHRITDGAEAARFMQMLGEFLENPIRLLL